MFRKQCPDPELHAPHTFEHQWPTNQNPSTYLCLGLVTCEACDSESTDCPLCHGTHAMTPSAADVIGLIRAVRNKILPDTAHDGDTADTRKSGGIISGEARIPNFNVGCTFRTEGFDIELAREIVSREIEGYDDEI